MNYEVSGRDTIPLCKKCTKKPFIFADSANVEKWRSLNLRIFMQIGSWDDEKRLTGTQFSRFFEMPKARERLVTALTTRLQQNNFDGLLISWYFPGCVRVRDSSFHEILICELDFCNF
jgi:GH18 family chitinase